MQILGVPKNLRPESWIQKALLSEKMAAIGVHKSAKTQQQCYSFTLKQRYLNRALFIQTSAGLSVTVGY